MSIPVAPGRWVLFGHTPSMLRRRVDFTSSLRAYGDIVRVHLGPMRTFFLTNPELVHQTLVTKAASFEKGAFFDMFRPYVGNGIIMSNGDFHRRQRRLVQPAFHRAKLAGYAETMRRVSADVAGSWKPGQELEDLYSHMYHLSVTTVGETLFSTELGKRAIAEARRSIPVVLRDGVVRVLSPSILNRVPIIPANRRFDQASGRIHRVVLDVIRAWRADGRDRGDLLSMLLLARDEDTGEAMSDQQVFDEVLNLFIAGSETSGLALTWLFHQFAENPDVERRVRDEMDQVLAGRPITFDDVPKMQYTRQVINEVLRMYPIWFVMRRARTDVEIGGEHMRAGTEFIISPHAMHYDPRSYPEPDRFDPDRWTPERTAALPKGSFIPFGAGSRQCVGNSYAYTEMTIAVATILARWRLVAVPGKPVLTKVNAVLYPSPVAMTAVPV
ncbi:cytochrome P450 [Kibdelosporangium phytohabitans]|uniref:Cytochrome n=1 Tax=Kibdelosporangium phytohabitans TaxID=860235 RepID=A0A0N9HYU7_9PSEU|nr:cytochrome P450 [Kibdelosporangium phytohabitans]ALG08460.1 cytochrome [Kibdelosporangium phytohabitans]MBE1470479.1 cytochrome P450 [Kibdelosporangium phytohabitans]